MAAEKVKSSRSTSPLVEKNNEGICFVIMPFGGWFNDYYSTIYCPAIKNANLNPHRADDLYRPSQIINDIWSYTQISKIILADLSGKNPNVFYELGLAHALAKPVILIAETIDDVPFDLRALRVLKYDKNKPRWGDILQEKITNAIKEVIRSPLEAVLPTFLSVDKESKQDLISKDDKLLLEMKRDIELLQNEIVRNRSFVEDRTMFDHLNMSDISKMIYNKIQKGYPNKVIVSQLTNLGWPEFYITEEIDRIKNQMDIMK